MCCLRVILIVSACNYRSSLGCTVERKIDQLLPLSFDMKFIWLQMTSRQTQRRGSAAIPGPSTSTEGSVPPRADPKPKTDAGAVMKPRSDSGSVPGAGLALDSSQDGTVDALQRIEARFSALESCLTQQSEYPESVQDQSSEQETIGESDWEQGSEVSRSASPVQHKRATVKRKGSKKEQVSDGDQYARERKKSGLKRKLSRPKSKKHHKKRKLSSSDSTSSSSDGGVDSDTSRKGVLATEFVTAADKRETVPEAKVRVSTLLRSALDGHYNTFKPLETIVKGAARFTGVKGVASSFPREMDAEVQMSDDKKKVETSLYNAQRGLLAGLTAILPVVNRLMIEDKYTSLAKDLNSGIELLASTSTYITYRRFENVFKGVTTEAGKEVTRSKKVKDKAGKEHTVFMAPKPIKGKNYNRQLMFGGQLTLLLKQVETGNKCGKQMGQNKTSSNTYGTRGRRMRPDFKRRTTFPAAFRGARQHQGTFRPRGQRPSTGWTDNNRAFQAFRPAPAAAAGKPQAFQRGGSK